MTAETGKLSNGRDWGMRLFSSRWLWNGVFRSIAFWGLVIGTVFAISHAFPVLDFTRLVETLATAFAGDIHGISTKEFAFALASMIGALAIGYIAAYFVMHAMLIRLALLEARRSLERQQDASVFANNFDAINQRLRQHPLIGLAWRSFEQTTFRNYGTGEVQSTVRPGNLINIGAARERLSGLKMMGSLPGYFVGVGLLLTFIGLVLALQQASAAVSSNDANGMQTATRELLKVATFKFATSIAGLGSSIVLSIFFRFYTVWIESAFDRFNHALENHLAFMTSQSIAWEMNESLSAQLSELKQINSADFFARMGENISPQIQSAFSTAMAPITASIDSAMSKLADTSQSGVGDLVKQFNETLHDSAGHELRELTGTLQTMQEALVAAQGGIGRTGEDFGRRMTEAADNLNRLVSDAGGRMNESSEQSRNAMMEVVGALRETFERANRKVDEQLGLAASGASSKVEEAMSRVMAKLEGQVESFHNGLGTYQQDMARQLNETNLQVGNAQTNAVNAVAAASTAAAQALQAGLADAMKSIRSELDTFSKTIRSVELGMTSQVTALRDATNQTRLAADAFGTTADNIRAAASPLLHSGERIASATQNLTTVISGASEQISTSMTDASSMLASSVAQSVASFEQGQRSAAEFAGSMRDHIDQLSNVWASYSDRFERVDEDLGNAIEDLSEAVNNQGQQLVSYVSKVDEGVASAISRLNPFLDELKSNTEDLSDSISELKDSLRSPVRA